MFYFTKQNIFIFFREFYNDVLVIIAVWEDTKNNNGLSKRKQQRISVYLYLYLYLYSVRQQNWNYRHW